MDARRFDRLTVHLNTNSLLGRRRVGALLATLLLGGGPGPAETEAKKGDKHKNKGKNNKRKCKKGALRCGKRCVNPRSNALHCGRCGNACSADEACQNGACAGNGCGSGQRFCENLSLCIPDDDPNRCCIARDCGGSFENPYGSLECTAQGHCVCQNAGEGRCSSETTPAVNFLCDVCCGDGEGCPQPLVCSTLPNTIRCECPVSAGYSLCNDGICTHVLGSDPQNCGRCDNVCADGFACRIGQCCGPTGTSCSQGFPDGCCSGLCHENGTCATCSSPDQCPVIGQTCSGGRCCLPSGTSCSAGYPCCSESCQIGQDGFRRCA